MIFAWTVQHTGTWTLLHWLDSLADVGGIIEYRWLYETLMGEQRKVPVKGGQIIERWGAPLVTVFHHHIQPDDAGERPWPQKHCLAMALALRTVIPVRDPLASCLTSQRRLDKNCADQVHELEESVKGLGTSGLTQAVRWAALARALPLLQTYAEHPPVWVPWDVVKPSEREAFLDAARQALGLTDQGHTLTFAQQWPLDNTQGDYAYKQAYIQQDAVWLEGQLPRLWAYLRSLEPDLRPWLEGLGYKKLLWWS
jgi:hypothetical protein